MVIKSVTICWDNLNTVIYEEDDEAITFCNNILKDNLELQLNDTFFENETYILKVENLTKTELNLICIWK